MYLFDIQSHFLFGNIWGFHGVEHVHQFSFLVFPFSDVLCPIDSGCDSVTDTETEDEKVPSYSKHQNLPQQTSPGNLMVVQPDRIRCGVGAPGAGGSVAVHSLFSGCFCCSKGSVILAFPQGFSCRLAALGFPLPGPLSTPHSFK